MRGIGGPRQTRVSLLPLLLGMAFGAAPVAVSPLLASASTGAPDGIGFSLAGCRGDEAMLPQGGPYLCPDADYTSGNLGKHWNELDLVPMRVTAVADGSAPAHQTYQVGITASYMDNGKPGIDYISVPVLNAGLSSGSCTAASASPAGGSGATFSPGINNADTSIYRVLSISQDAGSTCVYDYYQRLALGSHAYPGSALHSDLATVTVNGETVTALAALPGAKTIPLPVNRTTAPSLSGSPSAISGAGYSWTVSKSAVPGSLSMANTCDPEGRSQGVDVTITWHRVLGQAETTVVTEQVFADNPSGRDLNVNATATLLDDGSNQVAQDHTGLATVPAGAVHDLLATFTHSFPSGASDSYTEVVSGTFVDPVTGLDSGSTAGASSVGDVTQATDNANADASVVDTTGLSGSGLEYSLDSSSLAGGSTGAYTLGDHTTHQTVWTSPTLSGDGSTVLHFTADASGPMSGSGSLDDTAQLTGAGGFSASSPLSVAVHTSALFELTVNATIPAAQATDQSFDVSVGDGSGSTPATVTIAAGQTSGSTVLHDLSAGTYSVSEAAPSGWTTQPSQQVVAAAPTCAYAVTFHNSPVVVSTPTPTPTSSLIPATTVTNSGPTGAVQGASISTPNTGSELPFGAAAGLMLLGGGLVTWGRRRSR